MSKHKEEKTNVMRTLEQKKIAYTPHEYPADGPVDVYTPDGVCVRRQVRRAEALSGLPRGLYIVNHKKVIVEE